MNRKILSITLLLLWCAPVVVVFMFLYYQKQVIKNKVATQILSRIHKEDLVLLKSTKNTSSHYRWMNNKEFRYNGRMYDVVRIEHKKDTTYYWCWQDDEETTINQQIDHLVVVAFSGVPISDNTLYLVLLDVFNAFFHIREDGISIFLEIRILKYFPGSSNILSLLKSSPPVPPPEKVI